jgi:acyl-CoA thioester hydrolase
MTEHASPRIAIEVEVRYVETDQMAIVHHSNYLVWFELARTRLCASTGTSYAEVERSGYLLVVTSAELKYRKSARYGDTVTVHCRLAELASRGLTFAYEVRRGTDLLATGTTGHIWVESATGRPCRLPPALRPGFERLATSASNQHP